jgi:small subunit ribosomal protein S14
LACQKFDALSRNNAVEQEETAEVKTLGDQAKKPITEATDVPRNHLRSSSRRWNFPVRMAKTSWIERNERKKRTVEKYAKLRAELKAKGDHVGLTLLPRDASPTRVVNRCQVTGRRRGHIGRFKVSRLTFRELASQGMIPGVTKSSW